MAVIASGSPEALDRLTQQVRTEPDSRETALKDSCSWIPAGIGVQVEAPKTVNGVLQWVPAASVAK